MKNRNHFFKNNNIKDYQEYIPSENMSYDPDKNITHDLGGPRAVVELLPAGKSITSSKNITQAYLEKHDVQLVTNLVGVRGDHRNPDEILPKCTNEETQLHLNLHAHRISSNCSGLVSLTRNPGVAHLFGRKYSKDYRQPYYYTVGAKIHEGLERDESLEVFREDEVTVVGPPSKDSWEVKSFRKCKADKYNRGYLYNDFSSWTCGSIFIKKDVTNQEVDVHLKAHRTNTEIKAGVEFYPKKR